MLSNECKIRMEIFEFSTRPQGILLTVTSFIAWPRLPQNEFSQKNQQKDDSFLQEFESHATEKKAKSPQDKLFRCSLLLALNRSDSSPLWDSIPSSGSCASCLTFHAILRLAIPLVHSIKLKLEFAVLGKLVQLVTTNPGSSHKGPRNTILTLDKQSSDQAFPHFFDPNRATSDVTHAAPLQTIETRSSWRRSRLERRS